MFTEGSFELIAEDTGLFGPNVVDNYMHFKKCLTQCTFVFEHLMTTINDNVMETEHFSARECECYPGERCAPIFIVNYIRYIYFLSSQR